MKKLSSLILALTMLGAMPLLAQQKRVSPHETVSKVIDGSRVTITYGRPYTKDPRTGEPRKIWGGLVPYGQPWRFGADEVTSLITQHSLAIGETTIPAGAYTLYFVPEETGASKLVFSSALGGWGARLDLDHDVAKVEAKKEALEKTVDQFTITIDKNSGGGVINMDWENTRYSVAFTVKK